jgi:serine phosphatase RsbU (regulator of sigma subunit)/anti-sigma regulatory factor (Ser/Thr protein kinase)
MKSYPGICYKTEIRSHLDELDSAQRQLEQWIEYCGLGKDDGFQWKLVFTEAVTNAIRYGSGDKAEAKVRIRFLVQDGEVELSIEQEGPGPDLENKPEGSLPEDPFSEGGRGRFIIENFADSVEHWSGPRGYRLIIRKGYGTGLATPAPEEMNDLLNELTACYESLSAYNRLGNQLLQHESLGDFFEETFHSLALGHPFDNLHIYPAEDMPLVLVKGFAGRDFLAERPLKWPGHPERIFWESEGERPDFVYSHAVGATGMVTPVYCRDLHLFDLGVNFRDKEAMTSPEVNLLTGIADLLGIGAGLAVLQDEREAQARKEKEWEIATQLQIGLLPIVKSYKDAAIEVTLFHDSAGEVAGDYAMVMKPKAVLCPGGDPDAGRYTYLTVIDVMGKGVRAALLAILYRGAFHLLVREELSPAELLGTLNRLFCQILGDMVYFVTAVVCRFEEGSNQIEWCNAGHCDLLGLTKDQIKEGPPSGPPLGVVDVSTYTNEIWDRSSFERLAIYSDGCYEWAKDGELYGVPRLASFLRERLDGEHAASWDELIRAIKETADEDSHVDDVTLVLCDMLDQ